MKELGTETHPGEGVVNEKFPNSSKPSQQWVCGEFWNLRGQHNREEEKPTEYAPNLNSQGRSIQDTRPPAVSGGWTGRFGLHA